MAVICLFHIFNIKKRHPKPLSASSYLVGFRKGWTPKAVIYQQLVFDFSSSSSLCLIAVWKVKSIKEKECQCKQTGSQHITKGCEEWDGWVVWINLPFPHQVNEEMSSIQENHHLWIDTNHMNTGIRACLQSLILFRVPCCFLRQTLRISIIISVFI